MTEHPNVARLRTCYELWNETKGGSAEAWLEILADDFSLFSLAGGREGAEFTAQCTCKSEAVGYLSGLLEQWQMEFFRVDEILRDGDKVVVIAECAWVSRKTGKRTHTPKVDIWTFRDGEAVSFSEYYDTADMLAAAS